MHLRLLCFALVVIGSALFVYRWQVLDYPLTPDDDSAVWEIEAQIDIQGRGEAARVGLFVPPRDGRFGALEEDFVSAGLALTTQTDALGNRSAVWSTSTLGGRSSVFYRALFYKLPETEMSELAARPPEELPAELRFPPERDEASNAAAQRLAREIGADAAGLAFEAHEKAADTTPNTEMVAIAGGEYGLAEPGDPGDALTDAEGTAAARTEAAAFVLAVDGIHARTVHGLPLGNTRQSVSPEAWLEVWTGDTWRSYSAETGDPFTPDNHLVWWRGPADVLRVAGADLIRSSFALQQQQIGGTASLSQRTELINDPLALFTLTELPVNTQNVFRILLMIPVGALLLVILRQVVGVETLGTFMPVLIALAFRVTDLFYGIVFFTALVAFGLMVRFWFARLNLLLVPRLAAMLVVVILLMIGMSLLADAVSLGLGLSITLFPIVILTMTIERMSVTWEESGPAEALKQGLGSLVVAVLSYLVMNIPAVEHLLFVFPELSLLLLAALLALGRYSGYRLSELRRFRDLAQAERART